MASNDRQTSKNRHFLQSASHAVNGLWGTFWQEGNFRRESVMAVMVIIAAVAFRVTPFEWFILVLAILFVFLSELWNTIIENVVDLVVGTRFDANAKRIKDMSAGAVLTASLIAVICGAYVFVPHLLAWLK